MARAGLAARGPELRDASRALLENVAFKELVRLVDADIALAWRKAHDPAERETLHAEIRALEKVVLALKAKANQLSKGGT